MYFKKRVKFEYCNGDYQFYEKVRKKELEERINLKKEKMEKRKNVFEFKKILKDIVFFVLLITLIHFTTMITLDVMASNPENIKIKEIQEIKPEITKELKYCEVEFIKIKELQVKKLALLVEQEQEKKKEEAIFKAEETRKKIEKDKMKATNYSDDLIIEVQNNDYGIYRNDVKMPVNHQEAVYLMAKYYGLDFVKTLAVIGHESNFNPNAQGINRNDDGSVKTIDHGYGQINDINREWLSNATNTPDAPLNPYVNIKWTTYVLNYLYDTFEAEGYTGSELDEAVWSSYNRGEYGFRKYGVKEDYVALVYKKLNYLN